MILGIEPTLKRRFAFEWYRTRRDLYGHGWLDQFLGTFDFGSYYDANYDDGGVWVPYWIGGRYQRGSEHMDRHFYWPKTPALMLQRVNWQQQRAAPRWWAGRMQVPLKLLQLSLMARLNSKYK